MTLLDALTIVISRSQMPDELQRLRRESDPMLSLLADSALYRPDKFWELVHLVAATLPLPLGDLPKSSSRRDHYQR